MEDEIKSEFQRSGFSLDDEAQVLQQCLAFCINYNLSPSDLVSHWEVYYLNRQLSGLAVEAAHMSGFQSHILNEQKESMIREESGMHIYSSNDMHTLVKDEDIVGDENLPSTPIFLSETQNLDSDNTMETSQAKERSSSKRASTNSNRLTPFGQRTNKFVAQFSLNPQNTENGHNEQIEEDEDIVIRRVKPADMCTLKIHCSEPRPGCRFMYDKIEDKFIALESRIKKGISDFVASGLHGEPTDATLASQKNIFTVGMICCDGEGRMNKNSVSLQGSAEQSGGQRIRLDLEKLKTYSVFPGQQAMDQESLPGSHIDNSRRLSLIVAAGPFTTSDNLLFEPLAELLAYASRKSPQLLVLIGPFIDSEHPEIKNGTANTSFDDIFKVEIISRLQDYVELMGSAVRVVLLPATRDANHDHVFPQPAFEIFPPEEIKNQISCLSNPCVFSANEVVVGGCSVDILKHLSSEEIAQITPETSGGDRLGRLAHHVLAQRSFYPLYPPSTEVPLDLSLAPEALAISAAPDVLLMPSDLAPFVKVLAAEEGEAGRRCAWVNPGRLAKGIGGGTFAELLFDASPDQATATVVRI
ncbi:DNA polymerase alpha 2 isoform X2 [Wolffia australiana]